MKKLSLLAIIATLLISCNTNQNKGAIAGAGATFPLPFYNIAFKNYQDSTNINISYGGIGSGGGIRSLKDQVVDFAGSDAFLSNKEMNNMPAEVIHIPTCLGAVVLAYNLPEVENLNLSGDVIADIYLGKIETWNHPEIAKLNPNTKLPNLKINPVYRSDGSGTTFVFTNYLSKVSEQWKSQMGYSKALKWNTGVASKGNPGVAGTIKETIGSIGYIGSEYSSALNIQTAAILNSAGNPIKPSTESISAAASDSIADHLRAMITNSSNPNAYPISCFTWIIIYKEQAYNNRTIEQARLNINLVKWMINKQAQSITTKVHYAPLPSEIVTKANTLINTVTYQGKALWIPKNNN